MAKSFDFDEDDYEEDDRDFRPAARRNSNRSSSTFVDFLLFRRMLVPIIIQIVFWLGSAICIAVGFAAIFNGLSKRGESLAVLAGVATIILGPFLIRVSCELTIVYFRMNETLTAIKNALEKRR